MKVLIKVLNQGSHEVDISDDCSIEELQRIVQEVTTIETSRQRIIFQGRVLQSGTVKEKGVTEGSTLHVVTRLPIPEQQTQQATANTSERPQSQHPPSSSFPMGVFAVPVDENSGNMDEVMRQVMGHVGDVMSSMFGSVPQEQSSSQQHPNQPVVRRRVSIRMSDNPSSRTPRSSQPRPSPSRPSQTRQPSQSSSPPHRIPRSASPNRNESITDASRALLDASHQLQHAANSLTQFASRSQQRASQRQRRRLERDLTSTSPRKHQLRQCTGQPHDLARLGYFFPSLSLFMRLKGAQPNHLAQLASREDFIDCSLSNLMDAMVQDFTEAGIREMYQRPHYVLMFDYFMTAVYDFFSINDLITMYFDPACTGGLIRRSLERAFLLLVSDKSLPPSHIPIMKLRSQLIELNHGRLFTRHDLERHLSDSLMIMYAAGFSLFDDDTARELSSIFETQSHQAAAAFSLLFSNSIHLSDGDFTDELSAVLANAIAEAAKGVYQLLMSKQNPNASSLVYRLVQEWAYIFGSNSLLLSEPLVVLSMSLFSPNGRSTSTCLNHASAMLDQIFSSAASVVREDVSMSSQSSDSLNVDLPDPQLTQYYTSLVSPPSPSALVQPPELWRERLPEGLRNRDFECHEDVELEKGELYSDMSLKRFE
ncbi:hypothetical protein GEMRC1_012762 [Eukaryota sp. GEM-RC1]